MIVRTYCEPADLEAMIRLLLSVRSPQWISDYPTVLDLRELLSLPEMQAATQLWFTEGGKLAAFALVDPVNNLLLELDPGIFPAELEDQIVAWGMAHISGDSIPERNFSSLDVPCRADNAARKAFLERHAFKRVTGESVTLSRSLDEPVPATVLPPGFAIRPVAGEDELEAYVALHQKAFGTRNMTTAYRLAIMRTPDYQPELDLVAVAPDGSLAALCVCQVLSEENRAEGLLIGRTDPVATHPNYRRKGLARSLLLTGLRLLKERGVTKAELSTTSDNIPMIRTAEEAGFKTGASILWYSKPVQTPEI